MLSQKILFERTGFSKDEWRHYYKRHQWDTFAYA